MPAGDIATVKQVEQEGQSLSVARAGDSVDVGLLGVDPSSLLKGGILCHPEYPVKVATCLELKVLTLGVLVPILRGSQVRTPGLLYLPSSSDHPGLITVFKNGGLPCVLRRLFCMFIMLRRQPELQTSFLFSTRRLVLS